jgi:acyl-CoA thioesterase I
MGRSFRLAAALLCLAPFTAGCEDRRVVRAREAPLPGPIRDPGTGASVGQSREPGPAASAAAAARVEASPLVVFLGDSLTAGYGLAADEAFPAEVERLLAERGTPIRALNAGVSGDTSAGGLERLEWLLRQGPEIVVVELGGNDGLRGQTPAATEANLRRIIEGARAAGARVLLAGMQLPPSYGPEYVAEFAAIYPRLAAEYDVPLIDFLLAGVAARPELNLPDGIHPNAEGQRIVARMVAEALAPLVTPSAG